MIQTGDNMISNPSFEERDSIFSNQTSTSWVFDSQNSGRILQVGIKNAKDGKAIAVTYGKVSQKVGTTPGSHYMLSFYTNHVSGDENVYLHQEGMVEAPGLKEVFHLYNRPNHGVVNESFWQKNSFYFLASEMMSNISISSLGDHGIFLDLISVRFIRR